MTLNFKLLLNVKLNGAKLLTACSCYQTLQLNAENTEDSAVRETWQHDARQQFCTSLDS